MSQNTNTSSARLANRVALSIGFGALMAGAAGAGISSGLIVNGSFELGPAQVGPFTHVLAGGTDIPGWTVVNGNVDHMGTMWTASHGHHSIDLNGTIPGEIEQYIQTKPGQEYRLSFMLSANWGGPNNIKSVLVHAGDVQSIFEFDSSAVTAGDMKWVHREVVFNANVDSSRIAFNSLSPLYWGAAIDDVKEFPVPTPGAAGLALVGAACVPARRRRR